MKLLTLSTQLHKWAALVVAVQVLFWVGGGLVMTVLPIERVRGEHRIAEQVLPPLAPAEALPLAEVVRRAGVAPVEARLRSTPRGPVWILTPTEGAAVTLSARTGLPPPEMTDDEARSRAEAAYRGSARAAAAVLLPQAPQETGRTGPLWRVDFADAEGTTFYLAPETGEVVTRRSDMWRFYDLMWRLHILDLENGEDFNHPLLIGLTALTLGVVLTGLVLLWIRLGRDWRAAVRRRRPRP